MFISCSQFWAAELSRTEAIAPGLDLSDAGGATGRGPRALATKALPSSSSGSRASRIRPATHTPRSFICPWALKYSTSRLLCRLVTASAKVLSLRSRKARFRSLSSSSSSVRPIFAALSDRSGRQLAGG
eukprot:CAMPEP_0168688514 /NCGR_PEP_ID=MMETSP0503-20121227/31117_1 /TAXON_ID=89963 /ORGANISM="Heterocapsa rotundata, Strain SCCAP K-0483" /LENGTH=128 /DNA_ID=CAMNT_0008733729 /DNA_START=17 /DNA_END=400 /DNA_ORIENTATION=-